ncbi:MAG: VOC family protein [Roseibium sp.]|uniref:VOC family protein n=1 Tax=Roseibium sp. TaxID=1936156 RepID=UPI001B16744F|nr:VOC family protein [Roseibium sp.]MBO6893029.1 VOC family protein [Roseibium sp.]MBO6932648.1 VOC family protein [Roseibium sp.]
MARGLDHLVVAVKDLTAAGRAYEALGFTVTPENHHPWGTANRLVQLNGFFIELLSIGNEELITETEGKLFSFGAFNRDFLKEQEGASMLVLESGDPDRDRADFEKVGLDVYDLFSFERVANLADGSTATVAFDLTILRDPLSPGLGYFTCHNKFPENFWKPDFQKHANGAQDVAGVYMIAKDPSDHHEFLGGFTGLREMRATSLGLELDTPRGKISVLNPAAYRSLVGDAAADAVQGTLPQIAALEIACTGLDETRIVTADDLYGLTLILSPKD